MTRNLISNNIRNVPPKWAYQQKQALSSYVEAAFAMSVHCTSSFFTVYYTQAHTHTHTHMRNNGLKLRFEMKRKKK